MRSPVDRTPKERASCATICTFSPDLRFSSVHERYGVFLAAEWVVD